MKKRMILALVLVVLLIPSLLFAKAISLSLGGIAMYSVNAGSVTDDTEAFKDITNYTFGADVRLKLLMLDITAMGLYSGSSTDGSGMPEISGIVTAGLAMDLLDTIRVGVGLGPRLRAENNDGTWQVKTQDGTVVDGASFQNVVMNAPMTYRAMVDFMLGGLSVGASYMVDTSYTFNDYANVQNLIDVDWDSGKFGVSLLLNLQ